LRFPFLAFKLFSRFSRFVSLQELTQNDSAQKPAPFYIIAWDKAKQSLIRFASLDKTNLLPSRVKN
jgi:hypothetical protein